MVRFVYDRFDCTENIESGEHRQRSRQLKQKLTVEGKVAKVCLVRNIIPEPEKMKWCVRRNKEEPHCSLYTY